MSAKTDPNSTTDNLANEDCRPVPCSLLDGPIIDNCSPRLAAHLIEAAGEVPAWFSEKWDSLFGANDQIQA